MKMKLNLKDETGAATAEYAIATMAAVGFAGLLVVIMRSDEVRTILFDLVKSALTFTNPNGDVAPAAPAE
jgi:Flp pilus assembly pilin Flp